MNESDVIRLRHMLDSAQMALAFVKGYSKRPGQKPNADALARQVYRNCW